MEKFHNQKEVRKNRKLKSSLRPSHFAAASLSSFSILFSSFIRPFTFPLLIPFFKSRSHHGCMQQDTVISVPKYTSILGLSNLSGYL
jgi:hypothetical protein